MRYVSWGIIGCGDVTEIKSGPGLQKAEHSSLVAVMRRNRAKCEDYANRHNVKRFYENATDLLKDPEVNAVYIATPPAFHKEYTLMTAAAGKHVYVEKPMALNYDECLEMISTCQNAKVRLYVAYYRRALDKFLKIKEILGSGRLGKIKNVTVTHTQPASLRDINGDIEHWRVKPEISGGGHFFDVACHTLDILDFLLGPIRTAVGNTSNKGGYYNAEDYVTCNFIFESGITGTGLWNFASSEKNDVNELVGTSEKIRFSTFGDEIEILSGDNRELLSFIRPQHIQQPYIQCVVQDLLGTGKASSTGETGSRTSKIMDMIFSKSG